MGPAVNPERQQFNRIVDFVDALEVLSRSIDKLDTAFRREKREEPEILKANLAQNLETLDKGRALLLEYVRDCEKKQFLPLVKPGRALIENLDAIRGDMRELLSLLEKGGKSLDWYKAENLAMDVSRFKDALEAFKHAGTQESFETRSLSLSSVAFPALLTIGGIVLTREILKTILKDT